MTILNGERVKTRKMERVKRFDSELSSSDDAYVQDAYVQDDGQRWHDDLISKVTQQYNRENESLNGG